MPQMNPVNLAHVAAGHRFPPTPVDLSPERVGRYLDVLEATETHGEDGAAIVPPGAAATMALGALLGQVHLPAGTLHSSQEVRMSGRLPVGAGATCAARIANRSTRGGMVFLTLEFSLTADDGGLTVLDGTATLLAPESRQETT